MDLTKSGERLTQKNESRVSEIHGGQGANATPPTPLSMTLLLLPQEQKESVGGRQGLGLLADKG